MIQPDGSPSLRISFSDEIGALHDSIGQAARQFGYKTAEYIDDPEHYELALEGSRVRRRLPGLSSVIQLGDTISFQAFPETVDEDGQAVLPSTAVIIKKPARKKRTFLFSEQFVIQPYNYGGAIAYETKRLWVPKKSLMPLPIVNTAEEQEYLDRRAHTYQDFIHDSGLGEISNDEVHALTTIADNAHVLVKGMFDRPSNWMKLQFILASERFHRGDLTELE